MNLYCALCFFALSSTACYCQDIVFEEALAEMGVELQLPENIEMVPKVPETEVEYQVAFRFKKKLYEIRISLFPYSYLVRQSGNGDINKYIPLFTMGLLASIAKGSLYFSKSADLSSATVKKEFGANMGITVLIKGDKSEFGKGYMLIALVSIYKDSKGIVIIYFLYSDKKELDGIEFSQAYYCFKFVE